MTRLTPYAFGGIRSAKDPIFAPGKLLELARLLCGMRDRRALFAWCAREGVGLDSAEFRDGSRRVCDAWLDARRQHGVFFAAGSGLVVATLDFAACDETGQGLALVEFLEGKAPRFCAWLTAALEDGALFDHGKRTLNGLAISQGDVHDMKRARAGEVAAVQRAMKKLRAPRARAWRG